ncbi:hypothetical protein CC2G_011457 [Coprinopsis cinerea AmutBmut pab1-1]|nr:hypothetical protein CC2G_011457 [Coprinopsis cinerea AmutBmut pab1-1]
MTTTHQTREPAESFLASLWREARFVEFQSRWPLTTLPEFASSLAHADRQRVGASKARKSGAEGAIALQRPHDRDTASPTNLLLRNPKTLGSSFKLPPSVTKRKRGCVI